MTRTRILHVLYRMGTGGTELALQRLTAGLDPRQFENIICTVTPNGAQPPEPRHAPEVAQSTLSIASTLSTCLLENRREKRRISRIVVSIPMQVIGS